MPELFSIFRSDYNDLAKFITYFFGTKGKGEKFYLARFNFWWDSNPAFPESKERGWILKDKGRIVGFRGIIPTKFQLFGEEIIVYNSTTWRVSPEYRNQSMLFFFKLLNVSKDSLHFNTTPSDTVVKLMNAYKYKKIPGSYPRISILKTSGEFCFSASKKSRKLDVKQIKKPDLSFNRIWEKTKNIFPNTNIRTVDVINWYLKDTNNKKIVFGCYQYNELISYVICCVTIVKELPFALQWVDLWGHHPIENYVLDSLVNYTVDYAKKNSFEYVIFTHFKSNIGEYFKKTGLAGGEYFKEIWLPGMEMEKKFYFKASPKIQNKITEKNSFFVDIQGDYCLW